MKLKNILFEAHKLVKVVGGYPVTYEGNPNNYKAIISEPMNDRQKTDMIKRAKQAGYIAQPNNAGGVTIFVKEGKLNEVLPKFKTPFEAYDWIIGKRNEAMDIEMEMMNTSAAIQDKYKEMENDPDIEVQGGPTADRYANELKELEDKHKNLRAQFAEVMAEIDEYDQTY
tara:strand:- start:387 stop:896 length:510 start_codon:yes stop_codon:yes gene_type:complete